MKSRRLIVLAAGLCAVSAGAQALPAGTEDAVLRSLVEEALARNPEMDAARQLLSAARARPAQAGARPDPMFSVAYTNDGWSPTLGARGRR